MKIDARAADGFVRNPTVSCILVYGPDQGLVAERSRTLRTAVLGSGTPDPFRYAEPPAAEIADDPALLVDEAAALSLTGDRRVIRVAAASDRLANAFAAVLRSREESDPSMHSLVIAESADLGPRSALRQLFVASDTGAALACYADDANQIRAFAEKVLTELGHQIQPAATDWLARSLGGDRAILRNELEKLSLYVGEGTPITVAEVEFCLGDSARVDVEDAILAAIIGDRATLDRILGRCFLAGQSPVAVLRGLGRTLGRLHLAAAHLAQGDPVDTALKSLKPPVFWKSLPQYRMALRNWSVESLSRALVLVAAAEYDCKSTGAPGEAIAWRTALQISTAAGRVN